MTRLIVNADDLGMSEGVTRGIVEAHERGIVTSASLMVDRPAAESGAEVARGLPRLSVGLHAVLDRRGELTVPPERCGEELHRQLERFHELVGAAPTHVDSHHHVQRDPRVRDRFAAFADEHGLPMRERSVRHCDLYYGDAAISVKRLLGLLEKLPDGDSELGCHPGYAVGLASRYAVERERELDTLTDARVCARVDELGIELIGWHQL